MPSAIFRTSDGADDGYWSASVYNASESLRLGNTGTTPYHAFIRFRELNIPKGSIITSAFVRFAAYINDSGNTVNLNCHFNNEDGGVKPLDYTEAEALSLTSAIAWNSLGSWTVNSTYDTPELKTILQNIVDRAGYIYGNTVTFVVKDNNSDNDAHRYPKSYESSGYAGPELHITWTVPSGVAGGLYKLGVAADSGMFGPDAGGYFSNSGGTLRLGCSSSRYYDSFYRFPNVTIPKDYIISRAQLRFICGVAGSTTVVYLNVSFNAVDDAVAPTDLAEGQALVKTSEIAWDGLPAWTLRKEYVTIELKTLVQAIVDRAGWVSGQAMMCIVADDGCALNTCRQPYSAGVELHIEWEVPITFIPKTTIILSV